MKLVSKFFGRVFDRTPEWVVMCFLWASFFAIILLIGAGCSVATGALTPEGKAIKAAEDQGYTDVEIIDKAVVFIGLRGCDGNDSARYTVRGTNTNGQVREFYVCAGVLKGGTIRSQ